MNTHKLITLALVVILASCSATYVRDGDNVMVSASLITSQGKTITPTKITEKVAKTQAGILKTVFNWSFWKTLITSL